MPRHIPNGELDALADEFQRLGVGALGHVFHEGGLDLLAKLLFQMLAAHLVLIGPAMVADRADVHETDLQRIGRDRCPGGQCSGKADGGGKAAQQGAP